MHVVIGYPRDWGSSTNERKTYTCTVNVVEVSKKRLKIRELIPFLEEDLDDVEYPHDDAVVVSAMIGNVRVHCVCRKSYPTEVAGVHIHFSISNRCPTEVDVGGICLQ